MRTMSDETERRMCDEDFESDEGDEGEEGDVESYLGDVEEEDNSSELMDRLKELEAENSALLLANESQREAYERCLDEVANHVVQALLNQKDLREECIKLKMLVFDLERQNRALCELFQQKLPNHPTSQYQVQPGPLPDYNAQLHSDSAKQVEPQTEAQAKGNGYRTQHASPSPRGPAASMEALSPFFKKKAHILEVLRKMEETDPLKFHPSTAGLSFCDYSQVLMSTEAVLAAGELQCKKTQHTHCRCSCCDGDAHQQHVNGDGGHACKKSPDGPSKCNHMCGPSSSSSAVTTATTASIAAISDCHAKSTGAESSLPSKQSHHNGQHHHPHQQKTCFDSRLSAKDTESHRVCQRTGDGQVLKGSKVVKTELVVERDSVSITEGGCMRSSQLPVPIKDSPEAASCETETGSPEHAGPVQSDNDATAMLDDIPEKDTTEDEAGGLRADASVSPGPGASCLSDVKVAAISSPSKLLKFLKIPSVGERSQTATSPVRLSPQLTRNSRIPCRTNNYEVYHSPVPSRRATTAERCRQPPPPPARSESYPATHSAPTSPPQSEDATSPPAKELGYSSLSSPISKACTGGVAKTASSSCASSSSPRSARRVPHYENVCEVSHVPEKRTTLPSQTKPGSSGERKLVKSLPESVLRPAPPQRQLSSPSASSSSSSSSSSDQEDRDSESPVWTDHHSLPSVSALHKAQSRERPAQEMELRISHAVSEAPPATQAPAPSRKNDPSSIPKRPGPGSGRSPAESSHHAFKERLAALGKLRGSEEASSQPAGLADTHCSENGPKEERSKTAERTLETHPEEQRHSSKHSDSLDSKPKGNSGLKYPSQAYEAAVKAPPSGPGSSKPELCVTKTESPRSKIGLLSPNSDAPQVLRNNVKCPGSLNLPYNGKTSGLSPHINTNSPNKVPPKSPSKPCQPPSSSSSSSRPGKPSDTPRYASKSEERSKIGGNKNKRNPAYGDSLPPPPPRPPTSDPSEEKVAAPAASPQSAIEQKVMKGIEENMLKLQEQDRGAPPPELKHKASNGIASWFGLKKSKLPALSRKAEGSKGKDEKKEWKINIPSVGKDSKVAARCKEGVEGLNISTLMEKAEGLRRALEEERAYVERAGRGHSCEVVMDPAQGQLAVMYRGGRSDNFMQQLLNRVDGKEVISVPQRRLSFDCKSSRPVFSQQSDSLSHTTSREDMQKGSGVISNVTSDENLADPVHPQHFAGSGASTYTLDSGIGTFPLPDYSSGAAGRSLSKMRAGGVEHHASGSPGRVGRRARTLDREMGAQEESYQPHRQLIPTIQYGSAGGVIHEDKEAHGPQMFTPRSKTWTFPNLKTPAGASDPVYLAVEEEEENVPYVSPFRGQNVKPGGPSVSRVADPGSLPVPVQTGLSRRGKSRTPSVPEMNREAGLELLRERPEEALSPSRPQVLETPESLSDSLYDSLSSCGSQG